MTHGEELCSEMQQDSVVLTYLESVLMHQASGGNMGTPSTKGTSDEEGAACKTSISHSNRGGGGGGGGGGRGERLVASPSCEPAVSSQQRASKSTSALNVKKARLLQAEAWDGAKKRRVCGHGLEASDQEGSLPAARQSRLGKAQQQQHSTLLASLLQSFSSRLQNVALSQQGSGPRPGQLQSPGTRASSPEEDLRSYGLVSSHLRALLKNRDHSQSNHLPKENEATYQSPVDHQRLSGSPADGRSVGEPISCSARLRAVASMVENGARSASSPKPSVACSQLALLLSSDTQLQQYTREHSLGARAVPPSASERLAAIASQKVAVSSQPDPAQERPSKDRYRHAMSNGTSECQSQPEILERPGRFVDHTKSPSGTWEKSSRERNQTPMSPNSSSLLMHLLNTNSAPKSSSKNGTASANGHHWAGAERRNFPDFDYRSRMPAWEKPVKQEASSLEEAYSSDESSRSSCTPMDLSTKPRICEPISLQSRSLEQMTESLLFSWNPKAPGVRSPEGREDRNAPEVKSHQKVTLLQLLLGHQNGAKGSRTPEPQAPDLKNESPNSAAVHAESSLASSLLSRRVRGLETFQPSSSSSSSSSSSLSSSLQAAERTPAPRITNSSTTSASRQPQLSPLCHASNGPHRIFARRGKPSSDRELSQNHQHLSKQQTAAEPAKSHHFLEPLLSSESAKAHQFPKQLLPMELAKNNQYVSMQSLTAESRLSNFSFSASKLLQDLAHTGFHKSPEASQADTENKNVTLGSVEARVRESSAPLLFNRSADSLCFQQSVLPESGDEQNRCTLQAGSTSSADLENLLERRSVLQLLLRTPEKDKVLMGNLHGRPGDQQTLVGAHPSETRCNGQTTTNAEPISMVKVKTEPVEEETGFSSNAGALEKSANFQLLMPSKAEEKHPSFSVDNVKQELASPPLSPSMAQSHSSQKGGVLSQLLQRDNNATLGTYTFSQHPNTGSLQEAPSSTSGSNSPCNVPKKRKILPASPTDLDNLQKTLEQGEVRNNHSVSSRGSMNGLPGSQGNGRISDLRPSSGLEFESRSNGKDTQGFNVLKQLLLSENGIKVLSQHRTIQNGGSPSERGSPCDPKLEDYHSTHFYSKRDLDVNGKEATRSYEPTRYLNTLPSSSSADNLPTSRAASDSECQAPYRGPQADSPWLTKTNPILYYMLQRGGSGREGQPFSPSASRGRAGEGEMARKERRMPRQHGERPDRLLPERRVKDEPADSPGYPRGREALTPPDLSENTCRILEKVVAIKREPD